MGFFEDVEAIKTVERLGETEILEGERRVKFGKHLLSVYASLRERVDHDPTTLASTAETARGIADGNEEGSGPPAETVGAPRKPRSDIGKPRGPRITKPNVREGRTSPLTSELRAKIEATLSRGPMTLEQIQRMSWTADVKDVEGLLCEDAETFLRWTDYGSKEGRVVWGLVEHFDRAVGMLTLQCTKSERGKFTAEALGCSVYQALGAWKRLDPEAT